MVVNTPPMGWNTWNTYGENINEALIREGADALVEKGLAAAGYNYCVIDDCWAEKQRDPVTDKLVVNKEKFPNGMKVVADYVHSKGLKFGMYSCSGVRTCADYPGSFGHEFIDAATFAEIGCDFLKYDYCYRPAICEGRWLYRTMGQALRTCGREILFSACNWGYDDVYDWIRTTGASMYRSTGDINDNFVSFRDIATSQIDKMQFSGNNCFNDMDMLTVGMYGKGLVAFENGGCTYDEYKTQFMLWCIMGSPLMLGCDIRNIDDKTLKLVTNKMLIEINQDPQACQPYCLNEKYRKDRYIIVRLLSNGDIALGFFNVADEKRTIPMYFHDLGFPVYSNKKFIFTDVMTGAKTEYASDFLSVELEPHDSVMYRVRVTDK